MASKWKPSLILLFQTFKAPFCLGSFVYAGPFGQNIYLDSTRRLKTETYLKAVFPHYLK